MTMRLSRFRARWFTAGIGAGVAVALAAVAVAGLGLGLIGGGGAPSPAPAGASGPTPAPVVAMFPAAVEMPADADCTACHLTASGIGVNSIPRIAHPAQGWPTCTACHTTERLVPTAPGHTGIHASECTVCHTSDTAAAPARPHPQYLNTGCLRCHGATAPLPATMADRSEATCWLCHRAATEGSATTSVSR